MSYSVQCFCTDLVSYKQSVSYCITRAAMLSPPVLHFVILSLGCCSPAFIVVLQNSLRLSPSVKKKSYRFHDFQMYI